MAKVPEKLRSSEIQKRYELQALENRLAAADICIEICGRSINEMRQRLGLDFLELTEPAQGKRQRPRVNEREKQLVEAAFRLGVHFGKTQKGN